MQLLSKVRGSNIFLKKAIQEREIIWDKERKTLESKIEILQHYIEAIENQTENTRTSRCENIQSTNDAVTIPYNNEMAKTFNNLSTIKTYKSLLTSFDTENCSISAKDGFYNNFNKYAQSNQTEGETKTDHQTFTIAISPRLSDQSFKIDNNRIEQLKSKILLKTHLDLKSISNNTKTKRLNLNNLKLNLDDISTDFTKKLQPLTQKPERNNLFYNTTLATVRNQSSKNFDKAFNQNLFKSKTIKKHKQSEDNIVLESNMSPNLVNHSPSCEDRFTTKKSNVLDILLSNAQRQNFVKKIKRKTETTELKKRKKGS